MVVGVEMMVEIVVVVVWLAGWKHHDVHDPPCGAAASSGDGQPGPSGPGDWNLSHQQQGGRQSGAVVLWVVVIFSGGGGGCSDGGV